MSKHEEDEQRHRMSHVGAHIEEGGEAAVCDHCGARDGELFQMTCAERQARAQADGGDAPASD